MKKIIASQNAVIKNTYDDESQLSYMQDTTENNENDMDIDDPLKQIHDQSAEDNYYQDEGINIFEDIDDTITKETDDNTETEHYLEDISGDDIDTLINEIEAGSDISDYDEMDIEEPLIEVPEDENQHSQSPPTDYINSLSSIDEIDLLKSILDDQYQGAPLLTEENNEISEADITENPDFTTQSLIDNKESEYLLPTGETVSYQLDKKITKIEDLWDELSYIWPVINDSPQVKKEIENLWQSLRKNENYDDISVNNEAFNDNSFDINQDNYESTLHELNYIYDNDINILNTNNDLTEATDLTDLYSTDKDNEVPGISKVNSDYSDLALIESILSEPDTPDIDTVIEVNEETDEFSDNDSSILDSGNLTPDKSIEPIKETESISSLIDEILNTPTDNESTIDSSKDQLDKPHLEPSPLDTDLSKEIYPVNDAVLETEPTSTLPETFLHQHEIKADNSTHFPENSSGVISASISESEDYVSSPELNSKINSVKTSITNRSQLNQEKTAKKTAPSKKPQLDYTSTLDKHATPKTDRTSSRKTASTLIFSASISIIIIASWVYFTNDEPKTERAISPLSLEQKSISTLGPDESPSNGEVNNREVLSKVNKNLSQEEQVEITHIETQQVSTIYQETEDYMPDNSINDDPASSQSRVDLSLTEYPDTNQLNSPYQDSFEYDTTNITAKNEIPSQAAINEPEQTSHQIYKLEDRPEDLESSRPEMSKIVVSNNTRAYEWALNLSSIFNSKAPAEDIVDLLHNKSIPAEIKQVNINGKIWFRIRIRGFSSKQHALNYMLTIQERTSLKKYWISKISSEDNNYE